jgi:hypothetical protein
VLRTLTALVVLAALVAAGCGDGTVAGERTATTPKVTPALAKTPAGPGEILVQGQASPATHGPYELSGTYIARFVQYAPEDPHLDFAGQTPFVARLDPHADGDDGGRRTVALFEKAAAAGEATIRAKGRLYLDVEFGDFPYVIRLTPKS